MLSTQLKKLADQNGWRINAEEESAYGDYNGYLFTAIEGKNFKAFLTSVAGISQDGLKALTKFLDENHKRFRLRNYELGDNFICIRQQEGMLPLSADKMEHLLAQVSGLLDLYELPTDACAVCGKKADSKGLYYGLLCHLHPACETADLVDYIHPENQKTDPTAVALQEKLNDLSDSMRTYRQAMTQALIDICAIPSMKGESTDQAPYGLKTAEALEKMLSLGEQLGFQTKNLDNRAGYIEWGEGEKLIAILCHLDVVPPGEGWQSDPWQVIVRDNKLIARGTSDDKGPAVASLFAIKALADSGFEPGCRIRLILGLDEESGMSCMQHYVATQQLPDAGFTPDAGFPVIYAEKGILQLNLRLTHPVEEADQQAPLQLVKAKAGERPNMVPAHCDLTWRLSAGSSVSAMSDTEHDMADEKQAASALTEETETYTGVSAHASTPEEGKNALTGAMQAAADKLAANQTSHPFVDMYQTCFGEDLHGERLGLFFEDESGPITINTGVLNITETESQLAIDIRYPVTQDKQLILTSIRNAIAPYRGELEIIDEMDPLYLPKQGSLVRILSETYQELTGDMTEPIAMGGGTYARTMPNIVAYGMLFPEDASTAHQVDEHITYRTFLAAAAIYREALRRLADNLRDMTADT